MLLSFFTRSNDEVLTTSDTCIYLRLRLKLFLHMRTAIFWHYTQHQNALPPENVMSFSIFFAAKESLVEVWKIHEVSGSYIKFQVHITSPSEMF